MTTNRSTNLDIVVEDFWDFIFSGIKDTEHGDDRLTLNNVENEMISEVAC